MASNLRALRDLSPSSLPFSRKHRRAPRHGDTKRKRVAILLATKQGERFLPEQLESFIVQTHAKWTLWVSDDGSTDGSISLIEQFQRRVGDSRVHLQHGPCHGHAANFLSLTCNREITADFFCYSDQDDVWEPDKLARALEKLATIPKGIPAMYCSRIRLIDETGCEMGLFNLWKKPPSFANALTQNIASGHTIVFNGAARDLLLEAGSEVEVASHDWWFYQLLTGCGGTVLYDPYPSVRHRQHGNNSMGANTKLMARINNARMLLNNRFRCSCDKHIRALKKVEYLFPDKNRQILNHFAEARNGALMTRLKALFQCGLYRQNWHGNICLILGALLKKI